MATLNEVKVWAIYNDRRTPIKVVAYDHNVSITTVWNIQHKKTYRDVIDRCLELQSKFREASDKRKEETTNYKP